MQHIMKNKTAKNYEQEYEQRFESRKARQVDNLKELSEIAQSGGAEAIKAFPSLWNFDNSDDPKDALRYSILMLWCEAAECYIFGEFQSCILTCGAIVERCLKLQYEEVNGPIPKGKQWTLDTCIKRCRGIVSQDVLQLARSVAKKRHSRAHALLEHSDPELAISGGSERRVDRLSSQHYLVESYHGDAKNVIVATCEILAKLYGVK
jgi:hypothetical protein